MKKIYILLKIFLLYVIIDNAYCEDYNTKGFYLGIGTGINITTNYDFFKTYINPNNQFAFEKLDNNGQILGISVPFMIYAGYRIFEYLQIDVAFNNSGNQMYQKPVNDPTSNFWGSQNIFSTSVIGLCPLVNNYLYLKGRLGVSYTINSFTNYLGNPNTNAITSVLGLGLQYKFMQHLSIDFDYINFGLLAPIKLIFKSYQQDMPNLGVIDTININQFLISLQILF